MHKAEIVDKLKETLDAFYRDESKANLHLLESIELLSTYCTDNSSSNFSQLTECLKRILKAMEHQDGVTLCDILEFELIPLIERG